VRLERWMLAFSHHGAVLRLFTETKSVWIVQEISEALEIPATSVVRCVNDLVRMGLLERATKTQIRLGCAFIEFDRLIRLTDPVVLSGIEILNEAVMHARLPCMGILSKLHQEFVLCLATTESLQVGFRSSYERGKLMPLTRGAASKVILAHLPARRIKRVVEAERKQWSDVPFAPETSGLHSELAHIRKYGYCISRGEIDRGLAGIAAPIYVPERGLRASLSLVTESKLMDDVLERRLGRLLNSSASLLAEELRSGQTADGSDLTRCRIGSFQVW